jgi:DinB family protein
MSAFEPLPDAVLDWVPPAAAFEKFDPWAPDVRTIRGLLRHVLQFEVYYRDGPRDGAAKGISEQTGDPPAEHARTVQLLRSLTDDGRSRLYRPLRPGQSAPEEWTVRKMLRRTISHERAHTAEIQQRRTWLVLGVPGGDP